MEKGLSFFGVFDLAFFAPGAVVFWALLRVGSISAGSMGMPGMPDSTIKSVMTGAAMLLAVYLLGLLLHATQSVVVASARTNSTRPVSVGISKHR